MKIMADINAGDLLQGTLTWSTLNYSKFHQWRTDWYSIPLPDDQIARTSRIRLQAACATVGAAVVHETIRIQPCTIPLNTKNTP
jgi:hypothetical protein